MESPVCGLYACRKLTAITFWVFSCYDLTGSNPLIYHICLLDVGKNLDGEVSRLCSRFGAEAHASVTSFWCFAPASHFEESPLHIFVPKTIDNGVEESRDDVVE